MRRFEQSGRRRGFTLIEGLVAVAMLSALLALVVPSAVEWIRVQRVKASADELVTDLQFARSEAARRNLKVAVTFRSAATQTCYTIHTINAYGNCKCELGSGNACSSGISDNRFELKTVSLPTSNAVSLTSSLPSSVYNSASGFVAGMNVLQVTVDGGSHRKLLVQTNATGRPSICAPAGSVIKGYTTCS
jgi:prepilin-type N-terminal cleavage/methylation domain-containing protein